MAAAVARVARVVAAAAATFGSERGGKRAKSRMNRDFGGRKRSNRALAKMANERSEEEIFYFIRLSFFAWAA